MNFDIAKQAPDERRDIAIVSSCAPAADVLASRMRNHRRVHFGLYPGFLGEIAGAKAAIMVVDPGEEPSYAGLQQLMYLFHPRLAVEFGTATALIENLHLGDVAIAQTSVRCYCPIAITDGMADKDNLVFPSEDFRNHILDAPPYECNLEILSKALSAANATIPGGSLQSQIGSVHLGSFDKPLHGAGTRRYARMRYGIEVADSGAYGFFRAATGLNIPALCVKVMEDDLSSDGQVEFRKLKMRFLTAASETVALILHAL